MDEAENGEDTLTNPPNIKSMRVFRDNNTPSDDECSSDDSSIEIMPNLEERESTDEDENENEEESRGDPEEPFFMEREDYEDDDEASPIPVVEAPAGPSPEAPSADELRDEKTSESKNEEHKEDEDNKPDQPPATLQLSDQDSISLLNEADEANTPRASSAREYHTVTKTGRKCYRPRHLQKDHVMTTTANSFAVLGNESSDDESDDDPPPEVLAVGAGPKHL